MKIRQCRSALLLALFSVCALSSCAINPKNSNANSESSTAVSSAQAFNELVNKGDEALSRRAYDDAQVQYALALKQQPDDIDLLYKLSVVHYETDSFDVATELLIAILSKSEQHIGAHEMLGLIALKNKDIVRAEERLNSALSIDATRWRSQNAMGIVKDMQSQHAQAQQHFLQALHNTPNKAQTQNNLGYSYYLDGSYRQAEKHFRNATQLNSNYEKAWANLGLVYVRLKQYEDARYAFSKVVDDHVAANNLGYLSMLQGDTDMARQELARAVLIAPTYYPKANENLNSLNAQGDRPEYFSAPTAKNVAAEEVSSKQLAQLAAIPSTSNEPVGTEATPAVIIKESVYNAALNDQSQVTPKVAAQVQTQPAIGKSQAAVKKQKSSPELNRELSSLYLEFLGHQLRGGKKELYYPLLSFQASHQLEPTGKLDQASARVLQAQTIARVKSLLESLDYEVNTDIDGMDSKSIASLNSFQQANSLPLSTSVDKYTIVALKAYLNGGSLIANSSSQ